MSSSDGRGPKPITAGLHGAGAFGAFIAESLLDSPLVHLGAVSSRSTTRAAGMAARFKIARAHSSFEALLEDDDIELVILATPPAEHAPQALAALSAGKHVLIEKPLATTLEPAFEIVGEAKARGLVAAVDYPMLYTPLIEAVMLFNKSKLVGKLLRISVENIASCRGLDDSHWFWDKQLSGGIFIEHGVHFFDWCGRLAGDPKKVLALAHTTGKRENKVFASVEHSGGTIASYYHAFVVDSQEERTRVVLSYESVDVILEGWIPTRLRMSGHHAALATTTIRRMMRRTVDSVPDTESGFAFDAGQKQAIYKEGLRAAAEDVAMAIREPSHVPQCDARKALVSLRVAIAATNSADTGAAVELDLTKTRARP